LAALHFTDSRPWTVLYDADCGFCRWCLGLLLRADVQRRLRPVALATPEADRLLAGLTREAQFASWHLVAPDGERESAGAALATVAKLLPGGRLPGALLAHTPGLSETGYAWVAAHRIGLSRFVPGHAKRRATERIAARQAAQK
jgi:predicted DCC family thiol-disulfide oxidoreductase YuxK